MKRLAFLALLASCSEQDVSPDGSSSRDGGAIEDGAATGDAGSMVIDDFDVCGKSGQCANPDSRCVPVAPLSGLSLCLPTCSGTAECPVDTYCYQRDDGQYALMKGHCFFSYCGPEFENGQTGGSCKVGGEGGISIEEQLPGWCYPLSDEAFGLCLEVGEQAAGAECHGFDARCRGDGCLNCASGGLCVNGLCEELCDPRSLLTGDPIGCPPDQACLDRSELHVFRDGPTTRGSYGTCEEGHACLTLGPNTCPPLGDGTPQGCAYTNAVRPTGFCDPAGHGVLIEDEACPFAAPAGDPYECVHGTDCVGNETTSTCQRTCDIAPLGPAGTPLITCQDGTACQPLLWDVRVESDPTDNIYTADWGTCRAP